MTRLALPAKREAGERPQVTGQFRLAIEAVPVGMIMVDGQGLIALVNSQVEKLFGYPRQELIGQPIEMLVAPRLRLRHRAFRAAFFGEPTSRPMGAGRDLVGLRKMAPRSRSRSGSARCGRPRASSCGGLGRGHRREETRRAERERLPGQLRTLSAELEGRAGPHVPT
jgi:PAS domain-containing protein